MAGLGEIAFLDIEASGLGPDTFPIEVGWAFLSGNSGSMLIKPTSDWIEDAWDETAEDLHGISWDQLHTEGKSARFVADELNRLLGQPGLLVLSDAPEMDGFWLGRLFEQTPADQGFQLGDFNRAFRGRFPTLDLDTLLLIAEDERHHRAEADALLLRVIWQRALAA